MPLCCYGLLGYDIHYSLINFRFGRVQSVKILSHNKDEEGEAATVAFMDIKSANKAHSIEHKIEDRLLKTDYYDPSSFMDSNCDRNSSPRVTPEDHGPGPGGGPGGGGSNDFNDNSRSSHNNNSSRDFRGSSSRYDDSFSRQSSRSSRSYRDR